jgi:hypothetical protein
VWNRGGYAGSIIVNKGDGRDIADRLLPASDDTTDGSGELEWTRLVKP